MTAFSTGAARSAGTANSTRTRVPSGKVDAKSDVSFFDQSSSQLNNSTCSTIAARLAGQSLTAFFAGLAIPTAAVTIDSPLNGIGAPCAANSCSAWFTSQSSCSVLPR